MAKKKTRKLANRTPEVMEEHELIIAEYFAAGNFNGQQAVKKYRPHLSDIVAANVWQGIKNSPHNKAYIEEYQSRLSSMVDVKAEHITKEKVKIMQVRIERKDTWQDINFEGGRVTIEDDRVKIYHDEKPEKEVIQEIKTNGFRWSPFWKCWCRKHTGNAIYTTKNLSFIKNSLVN